MSADSMPADSMPADSMPAEFMLAESMPAVEDQDASASMSVNSQIIDSSELSESVAPPPPRTGRLNEGAKKRKAAKVRIGVKHTQRKRTPPILPQQQRLSAQQMQQQQMQPQHHISSAQQIQQSQPTAMQSRHWCGPQQLHLPHQSHWQQQSYRPQQSYWSQQSHWPQHSAMVPQHPAMVPQPKDCCHPNREHRRLGNMGRPPHDPSCSNRFN
jgi:hypothetical protein